MTHYDQRLLETARAHLHEAFRALARSVDVRATVLARRVLELEAEAKAALCAAEVRT